MVTQLSIFDVLEEIDQEQKANALKEEFLQILRDKKGVLVSLCSYAVIVTVDGDYINLPDESLRPEVYTITNYKNTRLSTRKKYTNLRDAVKDAQKRLLSSTTKSASLGLAIMAHYSRTCDNTFRGNTISETIMSFNKSNDEIQMTAHTTYLCSRNFNFTPEDLAFIKEHKSILPAEWEYKVKVKPEIQQLIDTLSSYRVEKISFTTAYTHSRKILLLSKLISYYQTMDNMIDLSKIQPLRNVNFRGIRGALANYEFYHRTINLNYTSSFFHEFAHHIDYMMIRPYSGLSIVSNGIDRSKVNELYASIIETLKKGKTLSDFIQKSLSIIEDKSQAVSNRKTYNRTSKHYEYYTSDIEIFARYFSDYMFYFYQSRSTSDYSLRFAKEDILSAKHLMEELLTELQLFKTNEKP